MKITDILSAWHSPKKGRTPQPENKVPILPILPPRLKDRVSGKSDKVKVGDCLQELIMVVSCLQKNEYENNLCQKEVTQFNACYNKFRADSFNAKRAQEKGLLVPGEKNLTRQQLRKLFRLRPML